MRQDAVVIKTNAYGLTLILDPSLPFGQLRDEVGRKFAQAARFFRNAQMALTFRGRELTQEEELALIEQITQNAQIHIVCIVDEEKSHADRHKEALTRTLAMQAEHTAVICRESLTSGMQFQSDQNVIVFGDVNPGAKVLSAGSVIILGTCMGEVTAGAAGDASGFIAATVLKPSTLRIAGVTAKSAITKRVDSGEYAPDPRLAYLMNGHLVMETLKSAAFSHYQEAVSKSQQE